MYHPGGTVVNFVTLRNLPELVAAIRLRAREQRSSLNKAVISLLQKSLGKRPRKPERAVYHDLDALADRGRRRRCRGSRRHCAINGLFDAHYRTVSQVIVDFFEPGL